ncbi:glycoside hydrolase [Lujinxingia litoralis]|uniref:Glycoside hydrolase n=1 Tax=Lujinxingia litoralis TaxID=2211119 RepID=A0A328CBF8_9DELT|nr:glycoside hydrolase family 57 protein [Lujinxingia litoralis]RAL22807.1 glycoside hydrolase [Lujinxingia litoralis]
MSSSPLDVLFLWHLHQPYYGAGEAGDFELPWVRLHAVKSYFDMAWLMERHPQMRATFNFSGSLLRQLQEWVEGGRRDRWWRWSLTPPEDLDDETRQALVHHFFSLDHTHGVASLPRYAELLARRTEHGEEACAQTWGEEEFGDLQMLFNLAWCGFAATRDYEAIRRWRAQGRGFSLNDRQELLELHLTIMARVLPLYRRLWEREQIEVSITPMYHPIMPLLIDTDSARRATPERPTPERLQAPDDARWHIDRALELGEHIFGRRATGLWPAEGSVSPEALALFEEANLSWVATDEAILANSLEFERDRDLWRSWRLTELGPAIFFRDHGLSDRIGFDYARRPAAEAADDLVSSLEGIARAASCPHPVVAIILDGENPWEHYPDDGRPFLEALYTRLVAHPVLRPTTPSTHLQEGGQPGTLETLHSGSWILGNYQIWIGHPETNLAWTLLAQARDFLRRRPAPVDEAEQRAASAAHQSLMMAQGSDWFWWYGDDFSSEQDALFDDLFRALLRRVWEVFGERPPDALRRPIHTGKHGDAEAVHRLPQHFISPRIDGRRGGFFDWEGAGRYLPKSGYGSMFETTRYLDQLLYGCDAQHLYLRLDPGPDLTPAHRLELGLSNTAHLHRIHLHAGASPGNAASAEPPAILVNHAYAQCWELATDRAALQAAGESEIELQVKVLEGERLLRTLPVDGPLRLHLPAEDPGNTDWLV